MKFKTAIAAAFAAALSWTQAFGQATILPPGETCFQATAGVSGMVGLLGTITGGSGGTSGTYGGVPLTGGSGSGATATITVSGGIVTSVAILNPGSQYVAGDVLSAAPANIGNTSGFSVPISSTSINSAVAGGTVAFYIPSTQVFKQTWQDAGQTILNQNPVPLDSNGCAVIYGAGIYRQILKDSLGNTVWDKLTAATSTNSIYWAGQAGGTPNAITITDPAFTLQDGTTIQFLALSGNTGPATVAVSGMAAISVVVDTPSGPAALSGGEIGPSNVPMITYDATGVQFHLVNPSSQNSGTSATSSLAPPQGYLNLTGQASGNVVQTGDVFGTSTVYYSPFVGNTAPIWNGTTFKNTTFTELTLALVAASSPSNAIQDVCVFSNNSVPTLVVAPSWTNTSAGAGNRGTGPGTAQLTRLNGIWVNAVAITAYNGLSSYSIPTNQCTYVGTLSIDNTAGQVTAERNYGQFRKWGIWNAYNRQQITVQGGDPTGTWPYTTNAWRAANNNTANSLTIVTGLPEETLQIGNTAYVGGTVNNNQTTSPAIGIGYNSSTAPSGRLGQMSFTNTAGVGSTISNFVSLTATFFAPPSIGINVITAIENGQGQNTATFNGTQSFMVLSASWRG